MKLKIKKDKKKSLNLAGLFLAVLLVLAGSYLLFARSTTLWPFSSSDTATPSAVDDPNIIDPTYGGSKATSDNIKGDGEKQQIDPTQSDTGDIETVNVAIAYAGKGVDQYIFEVRAFISGVIEGGGVCTARLIRDGVSINRSSEAFVDATTSQCHPIKFNTPDIESGEWTLTVTYESKTSTGVSEKKMVSL